MPRSLEKWYQRSSKKSVNFYQTLRYHTAEDSTHHIYSRENLKSHTYCAHFTFSFVP
jgi:hypothetical protein